MNPPDSTPSAQTPSNDTSSTSTIGPDLPSSDAARSPFLLRTSDVFAAVLLAAAFILFSRWPLWHTDVWGHLKFGQWIVQHRALPEREPFLVIAEGQPCIHFYWLGQSGMYLLFALGQWLAGGDELHALAGGVEMLVALFAVSNFLRCALLLFAYRRISGSMPLACVGLILALIGFGRVQRPQIFGEVFFAALLLALSRPVLSRRALVLVPVGMVLWANIHGSYAAGLALIGLFFLGRVVETALKVYPLSSPLPCTQGRGVGGEGQETCGNLNPSPQPLSPEYRGEGLSDQTLTASSSRWMAIFRDLQVRRLLLVGMLSTLAVALLNPHGPWIFLHTLQFSQNPNIPSMDEWKPLDFTLEPGEHWAYGVALVLVVVTQIFSPRLLSPTCLLMCVTFGVFPIWQRRLMIWWYLLVPWIILPVWAEIGRSPTWSWLHYRSRANARKTAIVAVLCFIAFMVSPPMIWLRTHQLRPLDRSLSPGTPWRIAAQLTAPPNDHTYLPELADALRNNRYPDGRFQGRIFASETQGDYLLWALPAEYPVLMYTHAHLISPDHWQDCLSVMAAKPGWREILDRHGVNLVVIEAEERVQLVAALKADSDWQIVLDETGLLSKIDPRTRLFVALRKKPLNERSEPRP